MSPPVGFSALVVLIFVAFEAAGDVGAVVVGVLRDSLRGGL